MGKKNRRGKRGSSRYRGDQGDIQVIRTRVPDKSAGELLGIVTQILGNDRMRVRCEDGEERLGRIRGKIKKRMWTRLGDLVLVSPWEFQPERCDIIYRYQQREAAWLEQKGYFSEYLYF